MNGGAADAGSPPRGPLLDVELITLFPELFDSFLSVSLLGKAIAAGLVRVSRTNPRNLIETSGIHRKVDDAPYGGGPGMVLQAPPVVTAVEQVIAARGPAHRVLLSPQGALLTQRKVEGLVSKGRLLFICGRYEGLDERICDLVVDEVLSIGDYVLAGGELAAAVVLEAASRLVPGMLGSAASTVVESHAAGRLEFPQYTRPPAFRGLRVPDVLLSGDHGRIDQWRRREALRRTWQRRPDLLASHPPDAEERRWLDEMQADLTRSTGE